MQLSNVLLIIIFGIIAVGLGYIFIQKRKKIKMLSARDSISLDEIYDAFFLKEGIRKDSFVEAWEFIAKAYNVDPLKMRPTDHFDEELRMLDALSLSEAESELFAYLESRRVIINSPSAIHSIQGFIIACCEKNR